MSKWGKATKMARVDFFLTTSDIPATTTGCDMIHDFRSDQNSSRNTTWYSRSN